MKLAPSALRGCGILEPLSVMNDHRSYVEKVSNIAPQQWTVLDHVSEVTDTNCRNLK